MRKATKIVVLGSGILVGASGAWTQILGQQGVGTGLPIRAPQSAGAAGTLLPVGYQGLTLGEFPAFQTFQFEGRSGAFGMAWRTQRHLLERARSTGQAGWSRGIASDQGLGYYLGEDKAKLLASMRQDQTHALSPRSFDSIRELESEIFRRLEGKEIRKLVFTIDSSSLLRRRYLVVFRGKAIEDQGEPGSLYDFYDPHAATQEDEVASALEAPLDRLPPALRGGRFGQLRVLPGSGYFQVSAAWAAAADAGAAVGVEGDDRFARPGVGEEAWAEVGIEQFGVADKGRLWGYWGGEDTPYLASPGEDRARSGWGSGLYEFRRGGAEGEAPEGYRFGTFDQAD